MKSLAQFSSLLLLILPVPSTPWFWPWRGGTKNIPECPSRRCEWDYNTGTFECEQSACNIIPILPEAIANHVLNIRLRENVISNVTLASLLYPNLIELDLTHNLVKFVADGAFSKLNKLRILLLSHNQLRSIESYHFYGLKSLETLELQGNYLSSLPSSVFYRDAHTSLANVDLSYNQIVYLPYNALTGLQDLTHLNLARNKLTAIDSNNFLGTYLLRSLDLSSNQLVRIQNDTFMTLPRLHTLSLHNNVLSELEPLAFRGLFELRSLNLSHNLITAVDHGVFHHTDLSKIDTLILDNNRLVVLRQGIFPSYHGLRVLTLNRNGLLTTIESGALQGPRWLEVLHIRECPRLQEIAPDALHPDAPITDLDLADNSLITLSEHLVAWDKLERVQLSGNKWRCDCRLTWLSDAPLPRHKPLRCAGPNYLAGSLVSDLEFPDFVCHSFPTVHNKIALSLIGAATLILTVVLALLLYRWRHYLTPCRAATSSRYVALFSVVDGKDDSVTISMDKSKRSSIVKTKENLAEPAYL